MMRAAVLRNGVVETRDVDNPVPGPGQLLVRSLACGICASDLHFMDHPEAGAYDDSGMSTYDRDVDIVMGHEYCAEVVDYGVGTDRRIRRGTRVSSLPVLTTPGGRRIIGQNPEAPGGFGEYFLIDEAAARVVVSDLPSEVVCIADALSVGWSAAARAAMTAREVPLVIGCGAIGLSVIAHLARLGIGPIIAVDFVPSRRATASVMGADVVVDPAAISPFRAWRDVAYGSTDPVKDLMSTVGMPGCVVFECVGLPGVLDSIIGGCERGTRIFSAGGPPEGEHLHTLTPLPPEGREIPGSDRNRTTPKEVIRLTHVVDAGVATLRHSQNHSGSVPVPARGVPARPAPEYSFREFEGLLGSRETPRTRHRRIRGPHQHHLPAGPPALLDQLPLDGRDTLTDPTDKVCPTPQHT